MLSPNFQTAAYEMEEYNAQPMCITYKFKNSDKVMTKEIFKVGSSFPNTKSVTFENKLGDVDLMVHYAENAQLMEGLQTQIGKYEIAEGKKDEKTEKCSFTMRVSNNIHNIACLDEAEFVQEWVEEEKIPIKTKNIPTVTPPPEDKKEDAKEGEQPPAEEKKEEPVAPQEPEFEIRKRNKKNFTQLKFSVANFALPPDVRSIYKSLEDQFTTGDQDILEMKELRNTLEAYSYEMRNNIDSYGSWEKYIDDETRKTFIAEINEVVDWIYGDGETAPKDEYKKKLDKFKQIGEPIKARHFYYSELDVYYGQFDKVKEVIQQKLGSIEHLTDAQKEDISKKLETAQTLIDGVKADAAAKQKHENPAYTLDQIISTIDTTKRQTEAIFNLPPPPPKSAEKEKEKEEATGEQKQETRAAEEAPTGDAEMKDEEKPKEDVQA